jgi:uncharacterized protein
MHCLLAGDAASHTKRLKLGLPHLKIPLFPLKTVLFPGGILPLRVFETRYIDMTRECLKNKQPFGVCLIHAGAEVGAPAVPEAVGTLAEIVDCDMEQLGVLQVRVRGGQRFRISSTEANAQGLLRAEINLLQPEPAIALDPQFNACAALLKIMAADASKSLIEEPYRFEDSSWVSYRLTESLPIPLTAKQKMLELEEPVLRLEILQRFLEQRGLIRRS